MTSEELLEAILATSDRGEQLFMLERMFIRHRAEIADFAERLAELERTLATYQHRCLTAVSLNDQLAAELRAIRQKARNSAKG